MPSAVLDLRVPILSSRLRFLSRQTHCACSSGSFAAYFVHHQEGQTELSLSVSRQAFGGIQRQEEKTHKTKTKIHTCFPTDKVFQETCSIPGVFHSLP